LTNTEGPCGEVMISYWWTCCQSGVFYRVDIHLDDAYTRWLYLWCFCLYTALDSVRAQISIGQARGSVSQGDNILRTPASDRAADVPRARLDNRSCTTRHLHATSDFIDTCYSKAPESCLLLPHHHLHNHLIPHKIPNAFRPCQKLALPLTLNEVAKYIKLSPHPWCKEQPKLAEDLRKKIPRVGLQARIPRSNVSSMIVVLRLPRPRLTAPSSRPSS
jgi:hypothetical protein